MGTILLYKQIGNSVNSEGQIQWGISGSDFAAELQYLQNQCTLINVRINSIGGSVLEGYSIVSAILNSKVPVDTYVDGLAASIAGVIAVSGRKCHIADYGTLMVHNPAGGNDPEVLALVKKTLVTILSNRTKKTAEEIADMMDKETWLNAKQAISAGLADEVITSKKKIKLPHNMTAENLLLVYNKLINTNMSKVNTLLKLSNSAEEAEQEAAIVALNKSLDEKEAELSALKNKLKGIEEKIAEDEKKAKEELKNRATELVNKAEKDGKITKDEVATTIENASKDEASFLFVSNMISKLGSAKESKKPFDFKNVKAGEDRSAWTYSDWEKKDAEGLTNLYKNDRTSYDELFNKHFKK